MQYPPDTGKKKQPDEDDKEEKQTDGRSRERKGGLHGALGSGALYGTGHRTSLPRARHAHRVFPDSAAAATPAAAASRGVAA